MKPSDPIRSKCRCQDCGWKGSETGCNAIEDLFERVAPGEPMPSGECPKCGTLCQPEVEYDRNYLMLATDGMSLEDLTYDYAKNGVLLRKQLDKSVLSNTGVWADVAFLHQDRNTTTDGWKQAKVTIARFKRIGGIWKKQDHFNVNSVRRVDQIIRVLSGWRNEIGGDNVQEEE